MKQRWNTYFGVEDVEALYADCRQSGTKIDYELGLKPYGIKEFGVQDLGGHDLAFGQASDEKSRTTRSLFRLSLFHKSTLSMSAFAEFAPPDEFTPSAVVAACFEQGAQALLIDRDALPPGFFDLSTGIAGELTQRLTLYGIRLACVVPDLTTHSERFQEFAHEANRGSQFRFFGSRSDAVEWLKTK